MMVRWSKVLMSWALAMFAFMATFNNLTDYSSNFAFVQHVLSMDTTFPGNKAMYRAMTNPLVWHAAYWFIILGEGITCLLLSMGCVTMWRARHASASEFARSKKWMIAGCTIGFLVWFFGVMVVGGEWFLMWQSETWNGQDAAFKIYMAMLGVLIYTIQPDPELGTDSNNGLHRP